MRHISKILGFFRRFKDHILSTPGWLYTEGPFESATRLALSSLDHGSNDCSYNNSHEIY